MAFQVGTQDPFFQPGNLYGAEFDWSTTPLSHFFLEQNMPFAFTRHGANMGIGLGDQSAFAQWFRTQYPQTQLGYGSALATNPTLFYQEYLPSLGGLGSWQRQFQSLSPQQRGERTSQFAPQTRWLGRN